MFYDFLMIFAIEWLLVAGFAALESFVLDDQGKHLPDTLKIITMLIAAYWYYVGSWAINGKTIGMQAWRIEVRAYDGGMISQPQGWLRAVASLLGLGNISKFIDRDRLGWHERLSRTVTVLDKERVLKAGTTPTWEPENITETDSQE